MHCCRPAACATATQVTTGPILQGRHRGRRRIESVFGTYEQSHLRTKATDLSGYTDVASLKGERLGRHAVRGQQKIEIVLLMRQFMPI